MVAERVLAERVRAERVARVRTKAAGNATSALGVAATASIVAEVVVSTAAEIAVAGITAAGGVDMIVGAVAAAEGDGRAVGVANSRIVGVISGADILAVAGAAETRLGLNSCASAVLVAAATAIVSSSRKACWMNTWFPLSCSGTSLNARFPELAPKLGSSVRFTWLRPMILSTVSMSGIWAKTVKSESKPAELSSKFTKKLLVPPF